MHSLCFCWSYLGMVIMDLFMFMLMVAAYDQTIQVIGPERVQEFHACVGTSAYIPWPLNVISRTGHKSTVVNLYFQHRHSERKMKVASFDGQRELKADVHFKDRLSISSENSGIFLDRVTMDDAGTYFAQAQVNNGQVWTRATNLTVHMRPIVYNGRLNVSHSDVHYHPSKHCVNITCGVIEYPGYPPAKYVWTSHSEMLSTQVATEDSATSIQICSPYVGNITCSIAGFSSVCTYDLVASTHLNLPGPRANATVQKSASTQDLVLTIVMPILAVLVPLTVLGCWVLSHVVRSSPHFRGHRHSRHQGAQAAVEIEEHTPPEHANDDGESDDDNIHSEVKEDIGDTDDDSFHKVMEGSNTYHRDVGVHFSDGDNTRVGNANPVQDNYERRPNEHQPLVEEKVIGTIV